MGRTFRSCTQLLVIYQWQFYHQTATDGLPCTAWWIPYCHWNNERLSAAAIGKTPGSDAIPMMFIKQDVNQWQKNLQSYFTACGERSKSHKSSRMHLPSTYTNGNEILKSLTTIGASLYCQLLGRYLLYRLNEHLDHDDMLARVQNDGQHTEPFPVTNEVKCI